MISLKSQKHGDIPKQVTPVTWSTLETLPVTIKSKKGKTNTSKCKSTDQANVDIPAFCFWFDNL